MIPRMKKPIRKLVLRRETLHAISYAQLDHVRGGGDSGNACGKVELELLATPVTA